MIKMTYYCIICNVNLISSHYKTLINVFYNLYYIKFWFHYNIKVVLPCKIWFYCFKTCFFNQNKTNMFKTNNTVFFFLQNQKQFLTYPDEWRYKMVIVELYKL